MLVSIGERGAMIVTSDSVIMKPCAKVEVTDTVGAGDCFLGSFAYFYAVDADLASAVEKACIVPWADEFVSRFRHCFRSFGVTIV